MAALILDVISNYWFWGVAGFLAGSILMIRNLLKNNIEVSVAIIVVTTAVYFGLFGTRLLEVLIDNHRMFINHPLQSLLFWQGGLSWQGFILGIIAGLLVLRVMRKPLWSSVGSMSPGLALAHAISRVGCLFHGCCFGQPTDVPWAIYSKRLRTFVHPTQLYSIIGELTVFILLQWMFEKRPAFRKYICPLYVMLFSIHRFIAEFFRGEIPGPELISGLRVYQAICILLFSAALFVVLNLTNRKWMKRVSVCVITVTAASFVVFRP